MAKKKSSQLPTPHQRSILCERATEAGLFEELLPEAQRLLQMRSSCLDLIWKQLGKALRVRMQEDPEEFMLTILKLLFTTNCNLAIRAQQMIEAEKSGHLREMADPWCNNPHREEIVKVAQIFHEMTRSLTEQALTISQVMRQLELVRRLKLKNDAEEAAPHPDQPTAAESLQQKKERISDYTDIPRYPPQPDPEELEEDHDPFEVDWGENGADYYMDQVLKEHPDFGKQLREMEMNRSGK